VSEAAAELYASDPDAFTERRGVLAARARAAGETSAAKGIAGLRKPTRSAWLINQLVRADPGVPSQLAVLGTDLRAAEAALDGARIRELSLSRRQLIDALVRQALAVSGQPSPPAALREEVTATLAAALADPEVAEQLAAGILLRAAHRAGFGSGTAPVLTPAPPPAGRQLAPAAAAAGAPARPAAWAAAAAEARAAAAEAARASAEEERRRAIADAEQAVADARLAADAAARTERELQGGVRLIEEQLAEARRRLAEARLQTRRADSAQRQARQALDRLRGPHLPRRG
jgi:hypothetical protein